MLHAPSHRTFVVMLKIHITPCLRCAVSNIILYDEILSSLLPFCKTEHAYTTFVSARKKHPKCSDGEGSKEAAQRTMHMCVYVRA